MDLAIFARSWPSSRDQGGRQRVEAIHQLWRRIEIPLRLVASSAELRLARGASEQAIKQLEEVLDVALPEEFRASYRLHDGGFTVQLVTPMEIRPLVGHLR